MKAIIWKELRECGVWAVLGLALALIAHIFAYQLSNTSQDALRLWEGKIVVNVFAAALSGSLLGAAQILPELRRDQWAFLFHRPLAASHIFAGKVIAGLLLLAGIVCLPDAVIFSWLRFHLGQEVITPWFFLLSVYVSLTVGTIFYFAAMIAALRPARVVGTRFLSIFGALAVAIFSMAVSEMRESLAVAMAAILVFGFAALGCFCAKGEYARMTVSARFALGGALLSGSVAIGVFLAAIVGDAVPAGFFQNESEEYSAMGGQDSDYKSIVADRQGRVLQVRSTATKVSHEEGVYVYSYSGWTLPEKQSVKIPPTKYPNPNFIPSDLIKGNGRIEYHNSKYIQSPFLPYIHEPYTKIIESKDRQGSQILYDNINRRVAFYSRKQGRFTGYIGPGGYYDARNIPSPENARFPGKLLSNATDKYYWFSNAIYRIDIGQRFVKRIVVARLGESIQSVAPVTEGKKELLWVVKNRSIEQYDEDGNRLYSVGLEPAAQNTTTIAIADAGAAGRLVWLGDIQTAWDGQRSMHSKIIETTVSGAVRRKFDLPVFSSGKHLGNAERDILMRFTLPLTHYVAVFDTGVTSPMYAYDIFGTYLALTPAVPPWFSFWSGIISAIAVLMIAMRCAMPWWQQLLWFVMAFPFGPSAVLTLLALRAWPLRAACDQCGKKCGAECQYCKFCGAPWPRPKRDGTEILSREFETQALMAGGQQ